MTTTAWNAPDVPQILIVDDTRENLQLLSQLLSGAGYKARPVASGRLALLAAEVDPPNLILLDITMPEMDGYEVCARLKADERLRDIPVIFISALTDRMDKVRAFGIGGVDYVTKPFDAEEVAARVAAHLKLHRYQMHLEGMVAEQVKEIADSQIATIFALAKLAESRDDDTGRHLERVQAFCRLLTQQLAVASPYRAEVDESFIDNIHHASPLHDIGKVGVSDRVLLKPARLTPEEFELIKTHASLGARTLEAVQQQYPRNTLVTMGIDIARSHHEKWDGSGYPDRLVGEAIPLSARIMALADVYDALRSPRCYKDAFSHEKSREIIRQGAAAHFDPVIVEAFCAVEREFDAIWTGGWTGVAEAGVAPAPVTSVRDGEISARAVR
jgi:putative two-component system response regulator